MRPMLPDPVLAQAALDDLIARMHGWPEWLQTVVAGVVTFVVAYLVVKVVLVVVRHALGRARRVDETLRVFLGSVCAAAGWIIILAATLIGFGIPATAVAGVLAAGTFVIGFALKDTLGNLAAGVVILLNKPYRVGEAVQLKGHDGTVLRLGVSMTELKTWDGRHVSVPNGAIMTDAILNWSRNATRRIDVRVGVAYDDDLDVALRTVQEVMVSHPLVLDDPAPFIMIEGLGDSGVNIVARPWLRLTDLGVGISELNKAVKEALEAAGCTIPFPQRDIHLIASGAGRKGNGGSGGPSDDDPLAAALEEAAAGGS